VWDVPPPKRFFLEFSSKKIVPGFMHFYCEELLVVRKRVRGSLINPMGAEDVKRTGG